MPWNGYRDHESDIGEGWDAIENCSLYIKDECRRRLGFGAKVDLSGAVVRSATELGNYALCATAAGGILSITQSTSSVSAIAGGLSTTNWPSWAGMNGRMYYTNGVEMRVSDDGASIRTVGITAPASAATASNTSSGGTTDAGDHLIRYRYYDSIRNRLSDPSVAVSVTVTAGSKIAVGYAAGADSTVDKIIIEMTPIDDSTYYRAATITRSGSSYTLDMADSVLILQVSALSTGERNHSPPTVGTILTEHRQRLWSVAGSTLYWSRPMYPESWSSVNYARTITLDSGDSITAIKSFYSDLYIFGSRCMRRLVYTQDPSAAMVQDVPGNLGAFNDRCVIKVDGGIMFGWGRNGIWAIDSMQPVAIGRPIETTAAAIMSPTALTERFVTYEPIRREILFFFPRTGSTVCKDALCYSLDTKEWVIYSYRQGITAATQNTQYTDRQRLMICDANGYAWRVGVSSNDGGGDGVVTATSGSTSTVINAINSAVVGQTLYNPATSEERLITSCNGSSITVAALATAPAAGVIFYIGSIKQRIITDWLSMKGLNEKKRPTKMLVAIRPEGDLGSLTVDYFSDFSTTSVPATTFASDTLPDGVSISNSRISLDLDDGASDGMAPLPTPADWSRVIRADIIAETPYDGVRFIDAQFRDDSSIKSEEE